MSHTSSCRGWLTISLPRMAHHFQSSASNALADAESSSISSFAAGDKSEGLLPAMTRGMMRRDDQDLPQLRGHPRRRPNRTARWAALGMRIPHELAMRVSSSRMEAFSVITLCLREKVRSSPRMQSREQHLDTEKRTEN
jgi:hypothetical protein